MHFLFAIKQAAKQLMKIITIYLPLYLFLYKVMQKEVSSSGSNDINRYDGGSSFPERYQDRIMLTGTVVFARVKIMLAGTLTV